MNLQLKRYLAYGVIWCARIFTFVLPLASEIMSTLGFWSRLSDLTILQQFVVASCLAGLVMLPMQLLVKKWGVGLVIVGSSIIVGRTDLKMASGRVWQDISDGEIVLLLTFAGWCGCIFLMKWLLSHPTLSRPTEPRPDS